ncbi:hypothetical protein Hanom_Chr04g00287751 [Helianthus anomalus]
MHSALTETEKKKTRTILPPWSTETIIYKTQYPGFSDLNILTPINPAVTTAQIHELSVQ